MSVEIDELEKMASKVHSLLAVLRSYCKENVCQEEVETIFSVLDTAYRETDKLLCKIYGFED